MKLTANARRLLLKGGEKITGHLRQVTKEEFRYIRIIPARLPLRHPQTDGADLQQSGTRLPIATHLYENLQRPLGCSQSDLQIAIVTVGQLLEQHIDQLQLLLLHLGFNGVR